MEVTGRIIAVLPARSGVSQRSGNNWMSQEYVIEVPGGMYPRKMVFNIFGEDRIKQFNIQPGEELTVSFDIDAREYNGRWFNDIRAFNITRGSIATPAAAPAGPAPAAAQPAAAQGFASQPAMSQSDAFPPAQNDESGELPF